MKKLLMLLLVLSLALPAALAESTRYVDGGSGEKVHLRQSPSAQAKSLGLFYNGTPATVLETRGEWQRVAFGGVTGWMMGAYLTDLPVPMTGPALTVTQKDGTYVNLRAGDSRGSGILAQVAANDRVYVMGETASGWSYVRWRSQEGYMDTSFLKAQEERAPITASAEGVTPEGEYIQKIIADNGQWLYFTSAEENPPARYEDVNFDGMPDIVVTTSIGASNFYTSFFLWDGGGYVPAMTGMALAETINYRLYPEYGVVESRGNNGFAGALQEAALYRWQGTELIPLRTLVSEELSETAFDFAGNSHTTTVWWEKLHVTIRDHRSGGYEGTVIYDEVFADNEWTDAAWFEEINDILWRGVGAAAYIQQYVVNTGNELHLVSISEGKMEEEVIAAMGEIGTGRDIALDVNFDGIADSVRLALTEEGEVTAEFAVCADGQYVPVTYPETLTAFQLYPRYAIVRGNGGTPDDRETCLFRWEGAKLTLIRRLTLVSEGGSVRVEVWDCKHDSEALLYGKTMTQEERMTDAAQNEIDEALWQGIIR